MPAPSFGLDHLVILVDDLDDAAGRYMQLGFTVAPEMRHPFGTANRLVMFADNFLELVGIVDRAQLSGPGLLIDKHLNEHGPGAFGIALNSCDIEADRRTLAARGIEPGPIGGGSRPVPLPDGRQGLARFSTSLIPGPPQLLSLFFFAQQHVPEVVWVPEWQQHANGARALTSILFTADTIDGLDVFFERLFGAGSVRNEPRRFTVQAPLGTLAVVHQQVAFDHYGWTARTGESGPICAACIEVESLEGIRRCAGSAAVPTMERATGALLIPPSHACGVALEFRLPASSRN